MAIERQLHVDAAFTNFYIFNLAFAIIQKRYL